MTNPTPATVAVPVELAEEIAATLHTWGNERLEKDVRALLPKPTPRLVAVTRKQWVGESDNDWFDAQPDLLTLLDDVLAETVDSLTARLTLRVRIRAALGVSS